MEINNNSNSVLITGGTQGLGFEIARNLIKNGCKELVIAGRDDKKGKNARDELNKPGVNVKYIQANLANLSDCKQLISESINLFPQLDSLCQPSGLASWGH